MATTTYQLLDDGEWSDIATDAAEMLLTSNGNGFFYAIGATAPSGEFGHRVRGFTNEPIVILAGETLFARSYRGAVTLAATIDSSP